MIGYRRTVLVIWPHEFDLGTTFEDDIENALDDLAQVESTRPHKRERKLIEFLLNVAKNRPEERASIAETLTHAACVWKDIALLERVLAACGTTAGVGLLEDESLARCIETFGFPAIQPQ